MSSEYFLLNGASPDDSDLGRARSMTNTLAQKVNGAIIPSNAVHNEFALVVHRLRTVHEQWTTRRITRKVPIISLKCSDPSDLAQHKMSALKAEKKQLATTVSSLFQEMQHLKQQNQNMAHYVENLRKVLHESKSYILSLKQRNDNLASDMDFQSDLHEKQRRVWKTKIRDTDQAPHSQQQQQQQLYSGGHSLQPSDNVVLQITNAHDLDTILSEYEAVIEKQREQIKYKNQQLDQQRNVFQHEKNQQYGELTKEMNHLKHQKQQEMEELHMKVAHNNAIIERTKAENRRLHKTLQVTNNELNANRKLMEASRPLNGTQTEQQLFQLEQDYLNLSEVLVACQHRVTQCETELDEKQHGLEDANRLIDEQNKSMEEYKKNIALLQANLAESKSDQSDLIEALQQEWEQCKEEVMRYKQKCRQLQHEKDELMAQNMNMQFENERIMQQQNSYDDQSQNDNHNNNNNDAELVVLIDDLQRKLQQKDAEVKSQEMLMAQLMEQQRAFQKRNKTLVTRLKAMKSQSNQFGHGGSHSHSHGSHGSQHRSSANKYGVSQSYRDVNEGGLMMNNGGYPHHMQQMPESVTIELKSVYDHYLRNPILSANVSDLIHQIQSASHRIVDNKHAQNDYMLPEFGGRLRINSPSTILVVMEDILVQRHKAITSENEAIEKILSLKDEHERNVNNLGIEKKRLNGDIRKLTNQLTKYVEQIHDMEEQKLMYETHRDEKMLSDLERVKKEKERIAQEFLQGANVWNAEKAIMAAERVQLENDITYVAHHLEELIIERSQFEHEADEYQSLYGNLIGVLREKGMRVEVEYDDNTSFVNNHNNNKQSVVTFSDDASALAVKDSELLNQRRKRNTMRLKLYQTTTRTTGDEEEDEDEEEEKAKQQQQQQQQPKTRKAKISIHMNNAAATTNAVSAPSSPGQRSSTGNLNLHAKALAVSNPIMNRAKSSLAMVGSNKKHHSHSHHHHKENNNNNTKRNSHSHSPKPRTDADAHANSTTRSSNKSSSIWRRKNKKRNKEKEKSTKEKAKAKAAIATIEKEAAAEEQSHLVVPVSAVDDRNDVDEADAYIPFDEPDEFNLLDQEYKRIAMKFVEAENDNFDITDSSGNMIGGEDVNLLAKEVLSQELQRKQQQLPHLSGWIEKKSPTFVRGWQKRWVVVREYNIFYGKNKTDIKDTKNEKERKKFLNAIPLLVVQYIVGTDHSRSGRKFEIVARDPRTGDRRHYQWKAASREECDKWVQGLNAHKKLLAARLQFLANTTQHQV